MIALAILAAATSLAATRAPPPCPGDSTPEINACLGQQLDAANSDLGRYVTAARRRLKSEAQGGDGHAAAMALADFDRAEQAWTAYLKAECGAVYDYWSDGTIRTSMELTCEIDLTRRHTHTVWSEWLTYMDSTPPILPEPPAASTR